MTKKKLFSREELKELGFEETYVPRERSGGESFTYYTLELIKDFYLISGAFEEETEEVGVTPLESSRKVSLKFIKAYLEEFTK